ncbi:hypothetical protein MTO96_044958 [Rhipicephalus appendiculatus]
MGARPTVSDPIISPAAVKLARLKARHSSKGTYPNNLCVKVPNGDATSSDRDADCAEPLLESRLSKASPNVRQSIPQPHSPTVNSTTPQPQPAAAAKRKATTPTETLRSEEDTTARIIQTVNSSVAEAHRMTVHATVADAVRAAVTEAFATIDSRLTNMKTRLANMETTVNNTVAGLEALRTATDTTFGVIKQSMASATTDIGNRVPSHCSAQQSGPTTLSSNAPTDASWLAPT